MGGRVEVHDVGEGVVGVDGLGVGEGIVGVDELADELVLCKCIL